MLLSNGDKNMTRLNNKVATVTGASSGIGRATAKLFAAEGAKVVVGARRQAELDSLVAEIEAAGGQAIAVAGDVREEDYHRRLVATAVERYGKLDIAFNNAGTLGEAGPTTSVSEHGFADTLAINLTASFLAAKHQADAMEKNGAGSIIFTSTFVGYSYSFPGVAAYSASSRHGHVPGDERHAGKAGLHHRAACAEAGCNGRGNRQVRTLSGLR